MPAQNHLHTYTKYKDKPGFFRCTGKYCTHFVIKEVLVGKAAMCPLCGSEFVLTHEDLRRTTPRCIECSQTKEARLRRAAQKMIVGLIEEDKYNIEFDKEGE